MKRVLYLCASQPIALDQQKINTLHQCEELEVHLLFWDRLNSPLRIPFQTVLPNKRVHSLILRESGSNIIAKAVQRLGVTIWFAARILQFNPTVIHACSTDVLVAARLAKILKPHVKIVFDLQDTPNWMWKPATRKVQRWLYQKVDQLMVTSPRFETHFLRGYDLLPDSCPITFVPNSPLGCLFGDFHPAPAHKDFTVSIIGGLRDKGTISALLEAANRIRKKGMKIRLFFAGVGPCRPLIESAASIWDNVVYYGPYDYSSDISQLYAQSHLVFACYDVSPDKGIHLACRLAEAIVCGLPVVVGEDTYMAEIVRQHGVGIVVRQNDPASIEENLRGILVDRSRWQKMSSNTRKLQRDFTYDTYIKTFVDVYAGLIGRELTAPDAMEIGTKWGLKSNSEKNLCSIGSGIKTSK